MIPHPHNRSATGKRNRDGTRSRHAGLVQAAFHTVELLEKRVLFTTYLGAAAQAQSATPMGINLGVQTNYNTDALFFDVHKEMDGWRDVSSYNYLPSSELTSTGYPIAAEAGYTETDMNGYPEGTYTLQYTGGGTTGDGTNGTFSAVTASGIGTIIPGTSATVNGVTTVQVSVQYTLSDNRLLLYYTPSSTNPSPISNLHFYMPGYNANEPAPELNPAVAADLGPFGTVRLMDLLNTNFSAVANWSDRTTPADFNYTTDAGIAYEDAVAIGNQLQENLWWNIPVDATPTYMTDLAELIKYGSDGVNPYTGPYGSSGSNPVPASGPVYPGLDSNLKVYIEFGNELWHTGFDDDNSNIGNAYAAFDANPTATIPGSNLANANPNWFSAANNGGEFAFSAEQDIYELRQTYNAFSAVYGASLSSQTAFVFAADSSTSVFTQAAFTYLSDMSSQWGAPSSWISALAVPTYVNIDSATDVPGLTLNQLFSDLDGQITTTFASTISQDVAFANSYGLPLYSYEGGQGLVPDNENAAVKNEAEVDPRMGQFYTELLNEWYSLGGSLILPFDFADANTTSGDFGLLQSASDAGSPKWDAVIKRLVPVGDANLDGVVDYNDFLVLEQNYGLSGDVYWQQGDFNGDGVVDYADLQLLQQNLNTANFTPAELTNYNAFVASAAATPVPLPETGIIGTTGSYGNDGTTIANVFDGNLTTYFDGPTANGDTVGLNFGTPQTITSIRFAPRVGFESRMLGGYFEGSNDPTFASNDTTVLYTISTVPSDGYTNVSVTPGTYQYIQYVSPANSFGDIAEMQVYGEPPAPTPTITSATTIENRQTKTGLIVTPSTTATVGFQITGITGGTLYQNDGVTSISDGSFITVAQGLAGLKFTPSTGLTSSTGSTFSFSAQASSTGDASGLSGPVATGSITVNPIVAPTVVTSPTNLAVNSGDDASFAAAATGTPQPSVQWFVEAPGSNSFSAITGATRTTLSLGVVTAAQNGNEYEAVFSNSAGSPVTTSPATLTVATSNTPTVTGTTTIENTPSTNGLVITANALDSSNSALCYQITNITNGTLYYVTTTNSVSTQTQINNGDFIYASVGAAGLVFVPTTGLTSPSSTFGFSVQSSVNGSVGGLGGSVVPVTITVDPTGTTAPAAPGTPALTSSTSTTATIAWTASATAGVSSYLVFRNGVQIGTTNSTTLTYPDSGLTPSNIYTYTVEAVALGLDSVPSGALAVTTLAANAAPGQLTGTVSASTTGSYGNDGDTYLNVFDGNTNTYWDSPNANGNWVQLNLAGQDSITSIAYAPRAGFEQRVYGGIFEASNDPTFTNGVVTLNTVMSVPGDGYTTVSVSPGANYQYIRYVAPAGSYGNIAEIEVFGVTPPAAPGTPTLTSSTSTTATIAWVASTTAGVSGYIVFRNGLQIGTTNSTTLSYPDSLLSSATTYSYTVEAVANGVDSVPSGALSVTTPPVAPATPTLTSSTSATATIAWTASASTGVSGYIVFRNGLQIGTTNSTTLTYPDSGLSAGTTYSYTVEAVANSLDSVPSGALSVTTPPVAPGTPTLTSSTSATATIAWTASATTGVSGYIVFRNGAQIGTTNSTTLTYSDSGLSAGTTYSYTVEAVASGVDSVPSGALSVTTPAASTPAPVAPATPTLTSSTSATATIAWTASATTGVSGYIVFRNGAQIGTTNSTTLTYSDSGLAASTTYSYTVEAVASGVDSLPSGALSVTTPAASTPVKLTGTASASTTGSYDGKTSDNYTAVFDGNTNTFWDSPNASGNYVQLNLGAQDNLTSIAFAPRPGFEYRMVGGVFEASNDPTFTTGDVTLYTVTSTPNDGLTTVSVSPGGNYQYIRYVAPANSYGNISEMQVFGTAGSATTAPAAPGTPTLTSSTSATATIAWTASATTGVSGYIVFRNGAQIGTTNSTTLTYSDSGLAASTTYSYTVEAVASGVDSLPSGALSVTTPAASTPAPAAPATPTLTSSTSATATIAWTASATTGVSGYIVFRNGAQIGTTNSTTLTYSDSGLAASTTYSYTVEAVASGVDSLPSGALSVTTPAASTPVQLTGTASASTTASYDGKTSDNYTAVFDGNTNTFWDSPNASGNYVQLNLGAQDNLTSIAFAPRPGFEYRMFGGVFEASNDPTFTTGDVTLYTVNSTPNDGLTTVSVSPGGNYQYIRYVAPANSYGNISEMQVFGTAGSATTAPAAPGTPTLTSSTSATATIAWTASATTGVSGYIVFRNGAQIGTTNSTTLTYPDSGLAASTTYSYTVEAVASGVDSLPSGALSVTTPAASTPAPAAPGAPTLTSSTSATATIAWTASATTGVSGYIVFRNGAQIGTTNSTTLTYSDSGLAASTTYSYTVEAVASGVDSLPSGALSVTTPAGSTPVQLTGTASASTTASYDGKTSDNYTAVFDGNTNTFWDSPNASGNYVQLNLGAQDNLTSIAFAPRPGFEYRMFGGVFEASNDPTFTTGDVTLYTVNSTPNDGLTTVSVSPGGNYQYIRYVAPANSYGNISEMQVFGTAGSATTAPAAPGTPTLTSSTSATATIAWTASATTGVSGYIVFRNGAQIGTTNSTTLTYSDSGLAASTTYSYTVEAVASGVDSLSSGALSVTTPAASTPVQLTGTASASTTASYDGKTSDNYTAVFDGNTNTFWDSPNASGNYVQLNLGTPQQITDISYAPRPGFEYRMVGGIFEASNDPTFNTGVVTLYTVTSTPNDGLTTVPISITGTYQYIRYVAPANSYGNIAEMQIIGY